MRAPVIVLASLSAIAITGVVFAVTTAVGGALIYGALFLLLPLSAAACLRTIRYSRTALFICSLGAMVPLIVGVLLTWPQLGDAAPYLAGVIAIFGGLAGMLSPTARAWHASASAHRLLDL